MTIAESICIGPDQENNFFMKHNFSKLSSLALILFLVFAACIYSQACFAEETPKPESTIEKSAVINLTETEIARYISDSVSIINSEYRKLIAADCMEIEKQARIRILIKTEAVKDLNEGQTKADGFFSEWIRSIGLDKRGILIYALLPEGAAHGKILLKVGIGLKYLITKEMGENILNQVILPNNAENNDGKGFMDGIHSFKSMLLDELAHDKQRVANEPRTFELGKFLWSYKEAFLVFIIVIFFLYIVFFVERCPKCGGSLRITKEVLKEPGQNTLGLQRKIYVCEKCGLTRRKKEPIYPSGKAGLIMRLSGTRRNVRID